MIKIVEINTQGSKIILEDSSPSNIEIEKWLDKESPFIKQNDFDTCRGDYSDGNYNTCNGYKQSYNRYLKQFEDC